MQLPASIAEVEGVGSGKSALLIASSGFGDLTVFAPSSDTQSSEPNICKVVDVVANLSVVSPGVADACL
jgi:hypothetical protein